jgi:hypothetical protein
MCSGRDNSGKQYLSYWSVSVKLHYWGDEGSTDYVDYLDLRLTRSEPRPVLAAFAKYFCLPPSL